MLPRHAPLALAVVSLALLPPTAGAAPAPEIRARFQDAQGKEVGTARLTRVPEGVRVTVDVKGLSPGPHGFHVHAAGRCEPPKFESAGDHWNPRDHEHGFQNPKGYHAGDLPNLVAGKDGRARAEVVIRGATLDEGPLSLLDEDGTALVIHANADDYRTDPSGESGGRIACAVIERR